MFFSKLQQLITIQLIFKQFYFQGVIDYIYHTTPHLKTLGILGGIDQEWVRHCAGFPNPVIPSDHLSLLSEFELIPSSERKTWIFNFQEIKRNHSQYITVISTPKTITNMEWKLGPKKTILLHHSIDNQRGRKKSPP